MNTLQISKNVVDRINDWKDMLAETGRPDIPEFNELPEDLRPFFKAVYKNVVMVEAYNERESMDIYDKTKYRYYPWFETGDSPAGFRFSDSRYHCSVAFAGSGSRLSLKSDDLARHVGRKHTDIYREMLES